MCAFKSLHLQKCCDLVCSFDVVCTRLLPFDVCRQLRSGVMNAASKRSTGIYKIMHPERVGVHYTDIMTLHATSDEWRKLAATG